MAKKWNEVKEQLQEIYPGMTKAVFCMGKNPAYYGVELTHRAKEITDAIEHPRENRKNPFKMSLRVTREMFESVKKKLDGRSFQEYLYDLVAADLANTPPKKSVA